MVAEWGKPINSPSFEESGMLPSNTAPQPGNIEARKTISGIQSTRTKPFKPEPNERTSLYSFLRRALKALSENS
jgi:hypothetical protein